MIGAIGSGVGAIVIGGIQLFGGLVSGQGIRPRHLLGAKVRLVRNLDDATYYNRTNMVNGVPQWYVTRDIPKEDLQVLYHIPAFSALP